MLHNICRDCGAKWKSEQHSDQCENCKRIEDEMFKTSPDLPFNPWRFARASMRERLGVIGDVDE